MEWDNVKIVRYNNARSIKALWRGETLLVRVPRTAGEEEIRRFLALYHDRIMALKPEVKPLFGVGFRVALPGVGRVEISPLGSPSRRGIMTRRTGEIPEKVYEVFAPAGADWTSAGYGVAMKTVLRRIAEENGEVLLASAHGVMARTGVRCPGKISVNWGLKQMGKCTSRGDITLSAAMLYMSEYVRESVMCHELAHLKKMDHSPEFHRECERLTRLNFAGRETILTGMMKPVVRHRLRLGESSLEREVHKALGDELKGVIELLRR